ncbi:MAG: hypothetical protein FJ088_06845 [Deltaproteobacteria bacterium]|nr:hypothetical protein [Deltaproteobacteria bacterium]
MSHPLSEAIGGLVGLAVVGAIIVALFLLLRAVILWYWRVDKMVRLLEQIEKNTRKEQ